MSFFRRITTAVASSSTRPLLPPSPTPLAIARRTYAVPSPSFYSHNPPTPPGTKTQKGPPKREPNEAGTLRPHLGIAVRPDHGLYHFFHKDKDGVVLTLEMKDQRSENSGRSWTAPELRRKSFLDLHTLWYLVLRERNVLATQAREWKVVGGHPKHFANLDVLNRRCRKTMARIKAVLNERRLAFKEARAIQRKVDHNNMVNQRRLARKAAREAEAAAAAGTLSEVATD